MEHLTGANRYWWMLGISGVVAILFGLMALLWPGLTLSVFIMLFGAYALVYGIVRLVAMFRAMGGGETWWTHLVVGLLSIAAGLFVFAYPGVTAATLVYVIAFWAIAVGIVEIVAAFLLNMLNLAITGLLSVLFGLLLVSDPSRGALALVMVIGIFAIVRGIVELILAIRAPRVVLPRG